MVALPAVQADFAVGRADASLPYTLAMIGFALGGVVIGRLADRFGIVPPLVIGTLSLGCGYLGSALAADAWQFALVHLLIGFGCSARFAPLIADISHWFERRRGIAVAICASGNYIGGAIWPPDRPVSHRTATAGARRRSPSASSASLAMVPAGAAAASPAPAWMPTLTEARQLRAAALGLSPDALQALLCIAGVACCVAMSMPQVHIVAYCGDLGYGAARGAEMLSLMLGFGIVSRIASGFIADRIGGARARC